MRFIPMILGALAVTLMTTQVSAESTPKTHTCRLVTGYGTAIGKGHSKLAAKERAREICGSKLIDQYFAQRGNIDDSAVDDLALACVNLECQ